MTAITRRRLLQGSLALGALPLAATAQAAARITALATFSILGDFLRQIGGDRAEIVTLVGPGGDVHVYEPAPADVQKLAEAGLLLVNGLGLEGWMPRLVQASHTRARTITATAGITPRKTKDGGLDPHAWQSVANARIYARNARDGLVAADPANAEAYRSAAADYDTRLAALDAEVRAAVAKIPPERRKIITTHDAFGYFASEYGIEMIAPVGISTDAEPSARDIAQIVRQIRTQKIPAIFLESVSDPRLLQAIARDSGAKIGGTLYADSLSPPGGPAGTYIDMVRHNIRAMTAALAT